MPYTNHLTEETSPYLLQHAHNPVDWYPWNAEALAKAKQENKPILLSIGYAACHWCHVMAHESFEDPETAKLMNELFVNIKVDREERPDLDKIYQTANYYLTQRSGGWPLTVFLTPDDLTPFFSGTYFPRETRYNLPSFKEVLRAISDLYKDSRQEINQQNQQLRSLLNQKPIQTESPLLNSEPITLARQALEHNFDQKNGGFGDAPKFPHPTMIEFLIRDKSPLAAMTLEKMAQGGIYDQLGGGFFRYSVDAAWRIPHFEKMLYDNAELLYLYTLASRFDEDPLKVNKVNHETLYKNDYFSKIAVETAEWALNIMQAPEGGFYASLDADTEGHEGKYYVWNKFAISSILKQEEYNIVSDLYGLSKEPNFEKQWHFYIAEPLTIIANKLNLSIAEASQLLASAKEKLLSDREKRIKPGRDTKILTAWNALMIKGLFTAGETFNMPALTHAAEKALDFIKKNLWVNKRLLATYNGGKARHPAYLDDYAFLLDALLIRLQIAWKTEDLHFAIELADNLLNHFIDPVGGFYFTADDHEKLIQRPKPMMDEAIPAGNGIAAQALMTLGYLLAETRYLEAAEKTLRTAWPMLTRYPAEHCSLLLALEDFINPPYTIVIRSAQAIEAQQWQDYCKKQANTRVFVIPDNEQNLPGLLDTHKPLNKVCAYVCRGTQCLAVIDNFEGLVNVIISSISFSASGDKK